MRIDELNLAAFGPFTDRVLAFGENGLHIVYGPNEAGKSSALRGLKALLYGIDERTLDNFLHANDKLRIRGFLRTTDGQELAFIRRKGRKNTLLTLDGEPLNEQALAPFLQGVTAELFETLFGIDHQALVQGGQEILEQKGEVGQALFSAALGSHALHAVLVELDVEADGLFRPRGSTQTINSALKSYADLNKEVRECSLSSRAWDEHRRALGRTTKELEKIQSELSDNRIEVNRLQRIQRVLPKFARRRELFQELELLGDVIVLPEDYADRRQQAVRALETAQAIVGKATPRLEGLQQQLEGLSINEALLEQAEIIEDLHARLGGHRKALQDRPHLEAEAQQLLTDAGSILKEIRPDLELKATEQLRPIVARRQSIAELGSKNAVLNARVEQAKASLRETEKRLKSARKERDEITESGDTDDLHRAIAAARKQGELDASIQSTQSQLTSLQTECAEDLAQLTLWEGELEAVSGLKLPNRESVRHFKENYDDLSKRIQRLEEKKEELVDSLQDTSRRLNEIERVGEVPTESVLTNARSERDVVWQLLRRQWMDGEDVSAEASEHQGEGTLPDAFEIRLAEADEVSDRLRREADRVHALASLQAKQEGGQQQGQQIDEQLEATSADKAQLDADWQALWAPCQIDPRGPREMRAWLDEFEKLRDQVGQLNLTRQKVSELEQNRITHIQRLNEQLTGLGRAGSTSEELETVLLECEALASQLDESKRKHDLLSKEVNDREADVESLSDEHRLATEALEAWKMQWGDLMQSLGLRAESSPSEVDDFIERLRALFSKQGEAEKLRIRLNAIDEDAMAFCGQVGALVATIAPELVDLPADDAVVRLNSLLSENRSRQTKRQQIEEQIEQAMQEIQDSNASIQTMTDRLDALCVEAKCDAHDQFEAAERRSADYLRTKESIASIEKEILEAGEGVTIAELEMQAEGVDPDSLPGRITELNNKIDDELEPRRTELAETKGREEKEQELMDGSDHAALLADQAHAILARIRSDAERYVQAKLAGKILRDQIERYRRENQGPLVKRASEHFCALTLGSFEGLITDFNEKDEPVLAGIRVGGDRVTVEGMSSGTRDQLYLALRLASLEKYMESAEPMPFIVDDVLVDFDDARSQAALNALAELAEKTQVILFTHHSQVVEQSKQLQGSVQVHELGATA
ncbi:MAG: chromosome segregation protein SMC [gamma proteobacterium symbiont of Ctena orbiculata]|nr:MAG: chromosome segregation protein SMC [gamma proteobacterium symbiont of Ctena orbiculata]